METERNLGVVVIAGPPASGKSTQCKLLLERYGLTHISAGDLLRARQKFIPELSHYMSNGLLVPDDLVCSIVKERLSENDCRGKVLLDGFPRTRAQAKVLEEMGVRVNHFILMQVPDKEVIGRVSGRRLDPITGSIYHVTSNPPKDEKIASRLITREDDTEEKMVQRLKVYHENISAIANFYKKTVRFVNANVHPDAVFDQIRRSLEGDMYWGCVINRKATVRSYETSGAFDVGGSLDMISISRYFDHMSWLMRTRGVLADIKVDDIRFVDRAQTAEMMGILVPGLDLSLQVWLKYVGKSSITLGCTIWARYTDLMQALKFSNRIADGKYYTSALGDAINKIRDASEEHNGYIEIARGSKTLVALNAKTGKPTLIPFRKRLKNLVKKGDEIYKSFEAKLSHPRDYSESAPDCSMVDAETTSIKMEAPPAESFETSWLVQPKDVSVDGTVSTAACVGYLETSKFAATSNAGYDASAGRKRRKHKGQIRHFRGLHSSSVLAGKAIAVSRPVSMWIETFAPVSIGDKVKMKTWIIQNPSGVLKESIRDGHECIGFHLYNESLNETPVLRGCQIMKIPEFKSRI
mmetsp:Transcript_18301/g.21161  ORF Transcript_18301/g.21161 Transcript_18301/m.21161 type:complete len:580 (+) Transcript_18301:195-1934(+)